MGISRVMRSFWVTALLLPLMAQASINLPANDATPLSADVSSKEMTRLTIEGGRVVNVRYLDGELDLQKDDDAGQVYIRPISAKKKINIFVTADSGKTYLVVLNPVNRQADSIVIQEKAAAMQQLNQFQQQTARQQPYLTQGDTFTRAIKAFLIGLANQKTDALDIESRPSYQEVPLWQEALFVRTRTFSSADLSGEAYQLTNVSRTAMTLQEAEFYKKGVLAVAIRQHTLSPGESTEVFVVTGRSGDAF